MHTGFRKMSRHAVRCVSPSSDLYILKNRKESYINLDFVFNYKKMGTLFFKPFFFIRLSDKV